MSQPNPFRRLNHEFYGATPSTYFRDRLKLLALKAARPDVIEEAIGDAVVWGQIRITHDSDSDQSPEETAAFEQAAQTRFVVTEAQVLLHHVAEALLRMFLAHERSPECPWLQMASLMQFAEFREEVAQLARPEWPPEREGAVGVVFLGGVPNKPPADWVEHRDTTIRLLRLLACELERDKNLYNAAKHGLTAIAGTGSVHFVPSDAELASLDPERLTAELLKREGVLGADGVNVAFLEREGTRKSGYTWFHKTQWLNPERAAWLTHLALIQMDVLWAVAKWRYLEEPLPERLDFVNAAALDGLSHFPRAGSVQTFRRTVATEESQRGDVPTSSGATDEKAPPATLN